MAARLYCYVDESGRDVGAEVFVVAVVIAGDNRDECLEICGRFERQSQKFKDGWGSARHARRMEYLRLIFDDRRFSGNLCYSTFPASEDFDASTITAIIKAVNRRKPTGKFTTLVYVDGLSKTRRHQYSQALSQAGISPRQVRGVSKDENNALIRLADAIAGFVRDAHEGKSQEIVSLFNRAKDDAILVEV